MDENRNKAEKDSPSEGGTNISVGPNEKVTAERKENERQPPPELPSGVAVMGGHDSSGEQEREEKNAPDQQVTVMGALVSFLLRPLSPIVETSPPVVQEPEEDETFNTESVLVLPVPANSLEDECPAIINLAEGEVDFRVKSPDDE